MVAAGLSGCFSEPLEGNPDGCDDGEVGCACDASGTCDAGLECAPSVDLCIPDGCDPGTELCTCLEGGCVGGLACEGGLCRQPGGTDGVGGTGTQSDPTAVGSSGDEMSVTDASVTSVTSTDGMTTSDETTSTTDDTMTTSPETSATTLDTTESDPTETSKTSNDDGMPDVGQSCHECITAQSQGGADCDMGLATCSNEMLCTGMLSCMTDCVAQADEPCIQTCCESYEGGGKFYSSLAGCLGQACSAECGAINLVCGG